MPPNLLGAAGLIPTGTQENQPLQRLPACLPLLLMVGAWGIHWSLKLAGAPQLSLINKTNFYVKQQLYAGPGRGVLMTIVG